MHFSTQAFIITLIPALCWGTMWLFLKEAMKTTEVFKSQFLFQLLGIPLLLILLFFIPKQPLHINYPLIIGLGVGETFILTLYFYALQIGELAIIGPVNQANVLVTVFLSSIILHESLGILKVFGIIGVLMGVILLGLKLHALKKGIKLYKGVAPALISTVGTGIYLFYTGISSRINGWYYTSLGIRVAIPLTILIYLFLRRKRISDLFKNIPWKWIIPASVLDVIGFSTLNYATIKYDISYVTVMSKAAPVISTILAIYFLREKLKTYQIVGLIIVIAGIISLNIR